MPAIPEPPETLTDGHAALRLSAERDIPEILIAHQDDPELYVRLGDERPPSGAELGRWMEHAAARRSDGTSIALTILEPASDECRGQLGVHSFDWDHDHAELSVWVAPQMRGKGLARRALRTGAEWLFASCGLERLSLTTEPDNEPMLHAARAAGFRYEGVLRAYRRERGARVDCAMLSLLRSD